MQTSSAYEVEQVEEMGVFKRALNIFFEPGRVFSSVKQNPKILIPMIIIILGFVLLAVPTVDLVAEHTRQSYEEMYNNEEFMKTQRITKEQAVASIEQTVGFTRVAAFVWPVVTPLIILIQAGVFFAVFKLLKGSGTFKQTFAVLTYSYFISLLGEAVRVINVVVSGKADVTNSLALLMLDDKTSFLYNFLYGLDLFGLWAFIVAALGLSIVHNVSRKKAYLSVISVCILFVAITSALTTFQAASMYNQFGITM